MDWCDDMSDAWKIERRIRLVGGGPDEFGVLTASSRNADCLISFGYRGRTIEAAATDFFEALCKIRLHLEVEGLMPFCYGASLNVFPSSMARDMGMGLKAYRMTMGKQCQRSDAVEIFHEGPDIVPAPVSSHREFFEEWVRGPRS